MNCVNVFSKQHHAATCCKPGSTIGWKLSALSFNNAAWVACGCDECPATPTFLSLCLSEAKMPRTSGNAATSPGFCPATSEALCHSTPSMPNSTKEGIAGSLPNMADAFSKELPLGGGPDGSAIVLQCRRFRESSRQALLMILYQQLDTGCGQGDTAHCPRIGHIAAHAIGHWHESHAASITSSMECHR